MGARKWPGLEWRPAHQPVAGGYRERTAPDFSTLSSTLAAWYSCYIDRLADLCVAQVAAPIVRLARSSAATAARSWAIASVIWGRIGSCYGRIDTGPRHHLISPQASYSWTLFLRRDSPGKSGPSLSRLHLGTMLTDKFSSSTSARLRNRRATPRWQIART